MTSSRGAGARGGGGRLRLAPSHLPEVRDRLADLLRETAARESEGAEPYVRVMMRRAWGSGDALAASPCWWVSADMEELAVAASDGVPDDVVPATADGFLVFASPLPASVSEGLPHAVRAVQWMAREAHRGEENGLSVALQYFTSDRDAVRGAGLDGVVPLAPIRLVGDGPAGVGDVMRAVWALSSEERVCEPRAVSAPRPSGGGGPRPDPMARTVKVLVLREPRRPGASGGDGAPGRYSHRFVVRGFWRNQPCGPGLSERRLTWVAPFVKGPAGAPLVERETVRVWRR